jgi:hypothetical protein
MIWQNGHGSVALDASLGRAAPVLRAIVAFWSKGDTAQQREFR